MRCKKCGKVMRRDEKFCEACGYYNGEKDNSGWDDAFKEEKSLDDTHEFDDFEEESKELDVQLNTNTIKNTEVKEKKEDLLEAFIGEDYKSIRKIPFNFFAFLLNWSYVLYRKLYITGIIGLIATGIIATFFSNILLTYWIIMSVTLGILFNFYYIFISRKRINYIKKKYEGTDKYGLMNICEEKGGTNLWFALGAYLVFVLVVFFSYVSVTFNRNHNAKFFKENSENKATCYSVIKVGYNDLERFKVPGTVEEAVCKISKNNFAEYDVYIKTIEGEKSYYAYFYAETKGVLYKRNTSEIKDLEEKKEKGLITDEEQSLLNSLKQIEGNYTEIVSQSLAEDELIKKKKNKSEKLNFVFSKEEVIR
ncbi:MAG: hypothetical protein IJI58_04865 [Bacilli bacterium]|nr:hypothetical protein [Bacilli bacterium]